MGKVTMLFGIGVGYVLGTRAGRERFDQLKQAGAKIAQRPEVQQAGNRLKTMASERLPKNPAQGKEFATGMKQRAVGVTTRFRRSPDGGGWVSPPEPGFGTGFARDIDTPDYATATSDPGSNGMPGQPPPGAGQNP